MVARMLSTAAVVMVFSGAAALAQAGRVPAEMPPAGYAQSQYVDSAGCVFIRAGFNGTTTWVPRFGDDRRPMCGYQPSGGASGAAQVAAAAPAPVTVTAPVMAAAPRAVAPRAVVAAAPTSRVPYSVAPEAPRSRAPAPVVAAPQAQVYHAQAGGLDTRWSHYGETGPSPCAHYSPHSQMYAVPSPALPDLPLRCGPQAQHPADALREQSPRGGVWEPWNGSPYPAPNNNVYMLPPPYAPSWPQPWLQGAGHTRPAAPAAPRATVSTMGTTGVLDAPRAAAPAAGGQMSNGRFVQIGTYGVPSNAQATVSRLQSRGLPVAMGQARSGGQGLQVVLAGPFASQAELNAALGAARAMGYSDAFVR